MKILKSRALHLSSPTSLNDEHEYKQFDKDAWKEMYMISFVRGQDESVAMWSMYGKRWEEGIKISFRSDKLENILHNLQVRQINTNQEIKVSSCYFTDIGYRNHKIIKVGSVANGKVLGSNNQLPVDFVGFIKDDIWSYENELRLIVKTNLEKDYKEQGKIKICIESTDFWESITITPSPRFKGNLFDRITNEKDLFLRKDQVLDNPYTSLIHVSEGCKDCTEREKCDGR